MSNESSNQTKNTPALEFHGGVYTSLVPFFLFIIGSFGLAFLNIATVEGFWLVAIACIIIGMWLCKDPLKYFDEICRGTASPLLTTAVFCWLWSGAVAGILKASGLVNGLIWLGLSTGLTGGLFVGFTFVVSCIYSTATGTGAGTVLCTLPVLLLALTPGGWLQRSSPAVDSATTWRPSPIRPSLRQQPCVLTYPVW